MAGHKFPKLIIEWRQDPKLKNAYTDALQGRINRETKSTLHFVGYQYW